ncbi:carboxypeptidase-like regulatory domain-containing protein, partial [Algoriphagus sp.]|uniref:carboxypeptidase-like regulatory domain-containing protein n=1 Tax=Algoriphagus sp. TaxID=1872435 RepID=UPI0025F8BE30
MPRNHFSLLFTLFFSAFYLFSFSNFGNAQNLNFTGTVKEESSGQELKDIHLFVANTSFQTFSDSLGRFSIPNIPPGRWELVIKGEGFETIQETIELVKNKSNNQDFLLKSDLRIFPLELKLSEKRREKLVQEFSESFLTASNYKEDIRLLNPDALIFSEDENSKETLVEAKGYLIFVNDKTGFLFTLYLLE